MSNEIVLISISKEELQQLIRNAIKNEFELKKDKKKLLTSRELCNNLKISLSTLSNWKAAEIIPYRRMGKRIYFDLDEVSNAMVESRYKKFQGLKGVKCG